MYGKHFESMYTGSMVGIGAVPFAVWGYIISHQKPPSFDVELNPKILAVIIGETEDDVQKAIDRFCEPDTKSRTDVNEGKKLVRLGEYLFHVVNGQHYDGIRNHEDRKAYWREQKQKKRLAATATQGPPSEPPKPKTQFTAPTLEMCKLQAAKIGLSELEAEKFFHFYESKGWSVGKGKMVSWVSSMSGWKIKSNETNQRNNQQPRQSIDRNIGNANEGKAHLYKALGNVSVPG